VDSRSLFLSPTLRPRLAVRDWLLALIFFVGGVWLFTRDNHFPSFYHPDEPSKARQVIDGEYNFNHPMMLLQATRVIAWIRHTPETPQPITEAGRLASALFSAGAVACLVLLACHLRGLLAGALTGAFLLANQHIYELSHYMKEDPSLILGVAAFFLTFTRAWLVPSAGRFALLGVACALAVSGKYLGVVVLPLAIWAVIASPRQGRALRAAAALASFVAIFVLINFPMLESLRAFAGNVERETDYAVNGHKGLTRHVPHGVYGAVFREATNPAIWIALAIYYFGLLLNLLVKLFKRVKGSWRPVWLDGIKSYSAHPTEWALALFPIAYVLMLSFSPKTHNRYFLPDTILFCALAAMGLVSLRIPKLAQGALGAFVVIVSVFYLRPTAQAFRNDSRGALVAYVRQNIPVDAAIVQDKRVNLPSRKDPRQADSPYFLDQPLLGKLFAADVGTIEELRTRGIHYVAVSEGDYGRYFLTTHTAKDDEKADYDRRKAFYQQLFAQGKLIWECKAGENLYLQPSIKLYYLP